MLLPALAGHHAVVAHHLHHRFTGPRVDYLGVLLAAAASWIGVAGVGEAALIAAGIAAAHGKVDLASMIATAWAGAMIGGTAGWLLGLRWGRVLITKPGPLLKVRLRWLESGEEIYRKRGLLAVYLAPSWMAGVSAMRWSRFLPANAVAALAWALLVGLGAYFAGPSVADLLGDLGTAGIVAVVVAAMVVLVVRRVRRRRHSP
ncbi:MAG: hypothetical protein QOC95_1979 [Thermoleophilaceae bacterium]|jgi:membrane-associated protein|nr:hypothetical protein [Thermoleophilaceae bacterium]